MQEPVEDDEWEESPEEASARLRQDETATASDNPELASWTRNRQAV